MGKDVGFVNLRCHAAQEHGNCECGGLKQGVPVPGQRDRARSTANFLRTVWVEYGCPGHGKGPWNGLGATAKTNVTTDITDGNERTPSGKITCALTVAQHLRAVFDSQEWTSVHMDMKINQVVVMYLDIEEILRPVSPPVISVCKGILTAYTFLFFWHSKALRDAKIQLLVPCLFTRTRTRSGKQHCLTRCISGCC